LRHQAALGIALVLVRLCQSEQLRNPLLPLMTGFGRLQQLLNRVVGCPSQWLRHVSTASANSVRSISWRLRDKVLNTAMLARV
jgi:hypothetical protein